jgi:NhaA family Na+:H+ antiporter
MAETRHRALTPPVDPNRDHVLGPQSAEMTLVEYGSYSCPRCHAVHEVIKGLRSRFGDRMRYVFRHRPVEDNQNAARAAELAEYAARTTGRFWEVHEALMERGPALTDRDLERIAEEFDLKPGNECAAAAAEARVREDLESAQRSGVELTPAFFIDGRRYTGTWDESSLADAMLGTLGHRIQAAAFDFVRWGSSSGLLLALGTILAIVLSNSPLGPAFIEWWETPLGFEWNGHSFAHSLLHWVNHGLLTVFFFVVGLEIKREFTVGHLASFRSGALPVIAALGGIALPALIYASLAPPEYRHGWGIPIGTDTAFAVALIVVLSHRVPIELRVFLTAAVIIDDIVAIGVIALFYTNEIFLNYLIAAGVVTALLVVLNRVGVYRALPYMFLGAVLWFLLHESGLHATLAGVILAISIPARPPANLNALLAQAAAVMHLEDSHTGEAMRSGPSEPTLHTLDAIFARIESPADKLLRSVEPWSSYAVLPIFALANAGVVWSTDVLAGQGRLIAAIALGLVVGKPLGLV